MAARTLGSRCAATSVVAVLGMLLAVLGGSGVQAYCWFGQPVSVGAGSTFSFYFTACSSNAVAYYTGNYSVASTDGGRSYYMQYGDQQCGTDFRDSSYFMAAYRRYSGTAVYAMSWTHGGFYETFYPKTQVYCSDVNGCTVLIDVCMEVYTRVGDVLVNADDCKPATHYQHVERNELSVDFDG